MCVSTGMLKNSLKFQRNFQFSHGINTLLKSRYERLRRFCDQCGMITHDSGECLPVVGDQMENDNWGGGGVMILVLEMMLKKKMVIQTLLTWRSLSSMAAQWFRYTRIRNKLEILL